jgi:hypothetical protein
MSSLFFEPAAFGQAGKERSLFFSCFLNQKFGVAIRALPIDGLIPGCKVTFREAIAAKEEFAPLGAAFNNVSGTVLLRAADTNGFAAAVGV